jgi:hypothetical protein
MNYISAIEIKHMSIVDSFMEMIRPRLISLKFYNNIIIDDLENIEEFEQIKTTLNHLEYYCERFIQSYVNTNKCDELGCLVFHVPTFEPIYKIAISLDKNHLPKDKKL